MSWQTSITTTALVVMAVFALLGIFYKPFKDTLLQRIALGGVFLNASGEAWFMYQFHAALGAWDWLAWSWALYCAATAWKCRKGA